VIRLFNLALALAACAGFFAIHGAQAQQSLGEAARKARKARPAAAPKHVITNDEIRTARTEAQAAAPAEGAKAAPTQSPSAAATDPAEEKAKAAADMQKKAAELRAKVADADREINLLEREQKLQAASFYGDAGAQLRNPADFAEKQRKFKADIEAAQAKRDAAKQQLEALAEQARRSGVTL
jgi:hypothetical protein